MNKKKYKLKYLILITTLFFILFFINTTTFAQDSILNYSISLEINTTTIPKALKQIEKKINYYFTYDNKIINQEKEVELSVKNTALKNCLDSLLKDNSLKYQVIDNHIIITRKELKIIVVSAVVIDKDSKQPMQFANVSLVNFNIGTITNDKGEFVLKIPRKFINNEICVSFIGYKNTCTNIKDLLNNKEAKIYLKEKIISLQEIIIRRGNPITLIKSALEKTSTNYFTKPIYQICFYRESVKKRNDFMFFSEAVLKIYKPSYLNFNIGQIKVLKARKIKNISKLDTVSLKLKSGLKSSLYLDIVKNRIDFIDKNYFEFYNYKMLDIVSFDDKLAYEIEFNPKEGFDEVIYKGNLYISINDFAIIGAVFKVSDKKMKKANDRFIIKKNKKLKLKVTEAKYRVSYKQTNNKYYINHVLASLKMKVKKRKKLFSINFETSFEMAVMDIDTVSVTRFKRKEISKLNSVFVDEFSGYDDFFWEDYNFIKPDELWQEAMKKIKKSRK